MQGAPFVMREAGYLRGFVVHSSRDMRVSRMGPWGQGHFKAVGGEAEVAIESDGTTVVFEYPKGYAVVTGGLDRCEQPPQDITAVPLPGFRGADVEAGQLQRAGGKIFVPGVADGDIADALAVVFDQIGAAVAAQQHIHPIQETAFEGVVLGHIGGGKNGLIGLPAVHLDAGQLCGVVNAGLTQIDHGWSSFLVLEAS